MDEFKKNLRPFDEFMGGFNTEAVSDPERLGGRLRTNFFYYWANYVLMFIVLSCGGILLGPLFLLAPCFSTLAIIAHMALRPQSVASKGTVKTQEAKSKAASMIERAKARAKAS